jgi:hypothetical protein
MAEDYVHFPIVRPSASFATIFRLSKPHCEELNRQNPTFLSWITDSASFSQAFSASPDREMPAALPPSGGPQTKLKLAL